MMRDEGQKKEENYEILVDYKSKIIGMLEVINDMKFLKRIYISLREYLNEKKPE